MGPQVVAVLVATQAPVVTAVVLLAVQGALTVEAVAVAEVTLSVMVASL